MAVVSFLVVVVGGFSTCARGEYREITKIYNYDANHHTNQLGG